MRIFVTGATGFIGRALILELARCGHRVTAWVRDESRARTILGTDVALASLSGHSGIREQIAQTDAVINLGGEPVFAGRWNADRKRRIRTSRVDLTRELVEAIAAANPRPRVLISASAIGFYGGCGDRIVEDDGPPGDDFLAGVCRAWEAEANRARTLGVRVFIPRVGIVFGAHGGALPKMVTPARFGAGGPLGSGRQYVPWIHLDDMVEMIVRALDDSRYEGAMIAAAPNPVTNRDLAKAIGRAIHRPSFMPVPAIALRLMLGESAAMLLDGQRVHPRRLEQAGYVWRYSTIESALTDLLRPR
jgi:hypothetical protein